MLYVMIGIPGAGKTTYAGTLQAVRVSTDEIRKEMFGKELTLRGRRKVRQEMIRRVKMYLKRGEDVVIDCMNPTRKLRAALLKEFSGEHFISAVYINTPLKNAICNNFKRKRHVPIPGIIFYHLLLQPPGADEGFDEIRVINWLKE